MVSCRSEKLAVNRLRAVPITKSHFTKEKKCQSHFKDFRLQTSRVIMNENCFQPACLALNPCGYYTDTFHIKINILSSPSDFNITSSLLRCDVYCSGEPCAGPNNSFIFPSLALPSPALHERRKQTQTHISNFVILERTVSSASPYVSAGSSVLLLSEGARTKWTKITLYNCFFFVEIHKRTCLVLNLFFFL